MGQSLTPMVGQITMPIHKPDGSRSLYFCHRSIRVRFLWESRSLCNDAQPGGLVSLLSHGDVQGTRGLDM
jgi:hypothetical protein